MKQEAIFITRWKDKVKEIIKLRYGKLDKDKINDYLDNLISKRINNPKMILINNYTNHQAHTDVLSITDLIEKNNLIIGGAGVLFMQHALKVNPLIAYILNVMKLRKVYKDKRDEYPKGSQEWIRFDIAQLNQKIKINSLETF